ncbi:hypothetical protein DMB92_04130 [Campylobacter sp. MIT 99-7217]|uniref:hypothetical protein n=1 Tax=Campylobacter sp. MIT 99-7217 TaxID=535091 RepID=UPI0011598628|nr:hypothetical protein [Campylobacter sp. MIT 99-7217]TQR33151.1 hypothetical protein DMB92_04130 [Campylobacter sp. MIT 99-7217]
MDFKESLKDIKKEMLEAKKQEEKASKEALKHNKQASSNHENNTLESLTQKEERLRKELFAFLNS